MTLEESSTYQAILQRGRVEALRETILDTLQERFGVVPEQLKRDIFACRDATRLKAAIQSAARVSALDEFRL